MNTGAGDTGAGQDATDLIGRLSQISSRTSLMAIDSVLRALAHPAVTRSTSGLATAEGGASAAMAGDAPSAALATPTVADVAREVGVIARRMVTTTEDFAATMKARSA
ncbi:hypothetical protein [Nitrospirillum iridis]|uniref:Uncharacterized protein n=1 Tax=Nitrospirillum iridis TaxID=765888 RepID=A0A7X0B1M8_9PROT|nr:hypothetical protein [Nitrospirillum iridis]MBB6254030.1 hypothetical protein [Nitrospirillum iridis]